MTKKDPPVISQIKAAELAGVKKQAISKLRSTRSFFTKNNKVDTRHPDWISYLKDKKSNSKIKSSKKNPEDFQWLNERPTTIQEEKIYADIIQKKIDIEKDVDLVIEKRIVVAAFGEIVKSIQSNFVDYDRRVSPLIAAKLGLPGTEKTIEKILSPEKKKSLENVISDVAKVIKKL